MPTGVPQPQGVAEPRHEKFQQAGAHLEVFRLGQRLVVFLALVEPFALGRLLVVIGLGFERLLVAFLDGGLLGLENIGKTPHQAQRGRHALSLAERVIAQGVEQFAGARGQHRRSRVAEQGNADAAGQDRFQQLLRTGRQQQQHRGARRFLQRLEEGVFRSFAHAFAVDDDGKFRHPGRGGHLQGVLGGADGVHGDAARLRLRAHEGDVGALQRLERWLRFGGQAVDQANQSRGQFRLARPLGTGDQVGVRQAAVLPALREQLEGFVDGEAHGELIGKMARFAGGRGRNHGFHG